LLDFAIERRYLRSYSGARGFFSFISKLFSFLLLPKSQVSLDSCLSKANTQSPASWQLNEGGCAVFLLPLHLSCLFCFVIEFVTFFFTYQATGRDTKNRLTEQPSKQSLCPLPAPAACLSCSSIHHSLAPQGVFAQVTLITCFSR